MNNPKFFPVTYYNGYSSLIRLKDIVRLENTGAACFVICKRDFSRQITKETYHSLYNTLSMIGTGKYISRYPLTPDECFKKPEE